VVEALELLGPLDGDRVAGLLHHAHQRGVATGVAAEVAQLALGDVEAATAPPHPLLDLLDGAGQAPGVLRGDLEDVVRDPLRRLGAHAR